MQLQIDDLGNVGIIIDDWNKDLAYKPRTLTTDYSTWITYISRKAVPAGIPITDITYWKPICRLSKDLAFDYQSFKDGVNISLNDFLKTIIAYEQKIEALEVIMNSFLATSESGTAFSNMFGNSEVLGINQKTLTTVFRGIYTMFEQITGQSMLNVTINITPDAYIKTQSGETNITVVSSFPLIDYVKVYFNNVLVIEKDSITSFAETIPLSGTTVVKVETMVLGQIYTETKTITMMSDFFVGAGQGYEDVYNTRWARPYDGSPQGQYSIAVTQGQRIIVIIPTSEASKIEQIEMNDFNIPMDVSTYGNYTIYTSINTYNAGTYIIDINY